MKPAWDQLTEEFKDSKYSGIYDVDCTAEGKELCEEVGVTGYPTIKYGDASDKTKLKVFSGGRDFDALKKFAEENLGPVCSPKALEVCDDEEKAQIEAASKKTAADLDKEIAKLSKDFAETQKKFDKKKRKVDEKHSEFEDEWKDYQVEVKKRAKADAAASKEASKAEKAKNAEKEKKFSARAAKVEKRKEVIDTEKQALDDEKKDMAKAVKDSGLKLMKTLRADKPKDEL